MCAVTLHYPHGTLIHKLLPHQQIIHILMLRSQHPVSVLRSSFFKSFEAAEWENRGQ